MYKFSVFTFSNKEIEMICNLMKLSVRGYIQPVKRNTLTKNVIRYAINWKLLEQRENGKLYIPQYGNFNAVHDLPVESLWRLVEPMLNHTTTGYSLVNQPLWENLNIYAQNSRHATSRDLEAKEDIMLKLSSYHYINFQMAGTIWCITREHE
jgi:hypothetical protein